MASLAKSGFSTASTSRAHSIVVPKILSFIRENLGKPVAQSKFDRIQSEFYIYTFCDPSELVQ